MRRLVGSLTLMLVAALLGGCTPGDPVVVSSSSPPVSMPVEPTPQWTDEEQAAIDAVQRYIDVWTYISQNLGEADWDAIYEVAEESVAEINIQSWTIWADEGWHLVGSPSFIPTSILPGARDDQGYRQHLYGCFVIQGSYVADSQGLMVPTDDRVERGTITYTVIRTPSDRYILSGNKLENKPC